MTVSEQQRNTPKTCESDQGVDDTAYNGTLSAENPCNEVEFEKPHKAPVNTSDDRKN